jgi:hypothetical protein
MIAVAEVMEKEIRNWITIGGTEVARREIQEMHKVAEIEIMSEREVAEIRGIQEIHGAVEEDVMIGAEMEDEMTEMWDGMWEGIVEIEVSTVKIEFYFIFGADLMRNKMVAETRGTSLTNDQDLEKMRDDEAGVPERAVNENQKLAVKNRPSPFQRPRRNLQKAEQPRRQ